MEIRISSSLRVALSRLVEVVKHLARIESFNPAYGWALWTVVEWCLRKSLALFQSLASVKFQVCVQT